MRTDDLWPRVRRRSRALLEHAVSRYGYTLVRAEHAAGMAASSASEAIPRGRGEVFVTDEYVVAPRDDYDVVRRDYYSPIPDLAALPDTIWQRRSEMRGVALDADAGMRFIETELAPFIGELMVPLEDVQQPGVFYLHNTGFESVDAELLYGMIRWRKPRRVVELGSGYSTLLINLAASRNTGENMETEHIAYDPYPREHVLGTSMPEPSRLVASSATDLPVELFEELGEGDILFVDTTHTVKLGSDVNFIVLDVLPRLRPGVLVHFHDVFLPWEYPRTWLEDMSYFWAEQYLLQAFLAFNRDFEVLVPAHAVAREHPQRLAAAIASFGPGVNPGSLWLVRTTNDNGRRTGAA